MSTRLDRLRALSAEERRERARRALDNMRGFIRRSGLTGWVKDRNAREHFRAALEAVVAIEDVDGIDAAARYSDRLTALRQEATAARLLSVADVAEIESETLTEA